MTKTLQLSTIVVATILVAGLVAVSMSDIAFAKKPETKKLLVQVRDEAGNPVPGAFCSLFIGFNFDFVQVNNGGIVKLMVEPDRDPVNVTCIDKIDISQTPPFDAQGTFFDIDLKDNGTTVLRVTLIPL